MNFLGLLGVILVVLKLLGYIAISWWLVLLPFYLGLAIFFAFLLIGGGLLGAVAGIFAMLDWRGSKKRRNF